jgi:outer membrane protein OmpA-like peptidoglycan-associated protein
LTDSPNNLTSDRQSETRMPLKQTDIEELREIIIGSARSQIKKLRERLDSPEIRSEEISRILPDAILLRTSRDDKLVKSIGPAVEKAIESSVRKNRKVIVDTLFPIMGPAIRKAVFSALQKMIQSFDKTLEYSFSLQGLKWRLESLRTKKPFGEIVLLNTLVYQVEQIFLIHNKTSLVIQHVVSKNVRTQDPDLVASMLSAIRDFIHDSFNLEKEETLDSLHMGSERNIWIEQGPHAALAAVIRGTPPEDLRSNLCDLLEMIHLKYSDKLEQFDGDTERFEALRPDLEEYLEVRFKAKEKKISALFWIIISAAILILAALSFYMILSHLKTVHYLDRLKAEQGILITSAEKHSGKYYVYGLRDPLASNPADLLREEMLDPEKFIFKMERFYSTDPGLLMKRANKMLEPPNSVTLSLSDDTLNIKGAASHQWIVNMRETIRTIPIIAHYDDTDLMDTDINDFNAVRERIENHFFLFEFRSDEILPGQESNLVEFIRDLKDLLTRAESLDKKIHVNIIGHADSLGTEDTNILLSRKRADKILSVIAEEGIELNNFTASGAGSREPYAIERTPGDRELNRRVTIRITK